MAPKPHPHGGGSNVDDVNNNVAATSHGTVHGATGGAATLHGEHLLNAIRRGAHLPRNLNLLGKLYLC